MGEISWQLIISVVGGLLTLLIVFFSRRLAALLKRSEKRKVIARYTLLVFLIGAGVIIVYWGIRWMVDRTQFSLAQFHVMLLTLFVQISAGILLFRMTWQTETETKQYSGPCFEITFGNRNRTINVTQLNCEGIGGGERLSLTWKTFTEGVEMLIGQIGNLSPRLPLDLCVGINSTGTAMAALIAGSLEGSGAIHTGYVRSIGEGHPIVEASLPPKRAVKNILVTDMEVKSGSALKNTLDFLHEKYDRPGSRANIKVAVLVAGRVRGEISHIDDLLEERKGSFKFDQQFLPDFLAFVIKTKVGVTSDYDIR
ncbi:MAG: hypothetical protein KAV00_16530 [Phycisphaerae bacterium]|nr:hypothetical protein [Phycisphaerae bacterium]